MGAWSPSLVLPGSFEFLHEVGTFQTPRDSFPAGQKQNLGDNGFLSNQVISRIERNRVPKSIK